MPAGRPTDYKDHYPEELEAYFNVPAFTEEHGEDKNGNPCIIRRPASLPTLAGFACKIGVHRETLLNWSHQHKPFFDALKRAKDHQERILVENGLMGGYDKTFAIFTAKNLIDWRDKVETEHSGHITMTHEQAIAELE